MISTPSCRILREPSGCVPAWSGPRRRRWRWRKGLARRGVALLLWAGGCCWPAVAVQAQPYMGGAAALSFMDLDCPVEAMTCDHDGGAAKVFAGYAFRPPVAVEGTYYRYRGIRGQWGASAAGPVGDIRGDGIALHALVHAPLGKHLVLLGKIGLASSRIRFDAPSRHGSERHVRGARGVGIETTPGRPLGVRIEMERMEVKYQGEHASIDVISASLLYRF